MLPMSSIPKVALSQHAAMRHKNKAAILSLLRREDGLPSVVVAKKTGLAPQTVSVLLRELEDRGLVQRGQRVKGKRGQPAIPMHLNPQGSCSVGISLDWRHMDIVLVNLLGEVLAHDKVHFTRPNSETILDDIVSRVNNILSQTSHGACNRLVGVGLARSFFGARYCREFGLTQEAEKYLNGDDLVNSLSERLQQPVTATHKGQAACLTEASLGKISPRTHMGYIYISTFVSGGYFVNHGISTAQKGYQAQIGNVMTAKPGGGVQPLHAVASLLSLETLLKEAGHDFTPNEPTSWDWDAISPVVDAWMDGAVSALAIVVFNASTTWGLSGMILDGVLPRHILSELAQRVQNSACNLDPDNETPPTVLLGEFGADAPAIGAAQKVLDVYMFSA